MYVYMFSVCHDLFIKYGSVLFYSVRMDDLNISSQFHCFIFHSYSSYFMKSTHKRIDGSQIILEYDNLQTI